MPMTDIHAADSCVLTIADVCLALSGLVETAALPPVFQAFTQMTATADLDCAVVADGPDQSLVSAPLRPLEPWSFQVRDGACELVRRDSDGASLWRIAAPLAFDRATVSWHPDLFCAMYGRYELALAKGLGLSLLVFRLRAHGGLALHGTAAALGGRGILCLGVSGAGKSTLARLLDASGATVLTDERPIVRQWPPPGDREAVPSTAAFRVHGSPWPSSAGFARNAWAPLQRIFFLEHGTTDSLTPLTPREAFNRLIHVSTIPWQDPALFDPCLETVEALLRSVPCAVLAFRPTSEAVELIRKDLSGE